MCVEQKNGIQDWYGGRPRTVTARSQGQDRRLAFNSGTFFGRFMSGSRRVNRRWRKSRIIRFCLELHADLLISCRSFTRTIPDLALLLALLATVSGPLFVQFVMRFEFIQIAYQTINYLNRLLKPVTEEFI